MYLLVKLSLWGITWKASPEILTYKNNLMVTLYWLLTLLYT